jgi:hypothetical protein
MGILMNQKGYVGLIVLNIGFRAGVVPPSIFSMLVITMILSSSFTIPLISMVVEKSLYEQNMNVSVKSLPMEQVRNLNEMKDSNADTHHEVSIVLSELSIILILPNLQTVSSILSLILIFKLGSKKITINSLRLTEITERESSVIRATVAKDVNDKMDPIMQIIETFGELNGIKMNGLSSIALKDDFPSAVIDASIDQHSNMILIPITFSPSFNSGEDFLFWAPLFEGAPCSVALFLDRGFDLWISKDSSHFTETDTDAQRKVFFPFHDDEDDEEALALASYIVQSVHLKVEILIPKGYLVTKNPNLEFLQKKENVLISELRADQKITDYAESRSLQKTDLILLGKAHYHKELKSWIENVCLSSVLLVKKHGLKKIIEVL